MPKSVSRSALQKAERAAKNYATQKEAVGSAVALADTDTDKPALLAVALLCMGMYHDSNSALSKEPFFQLPLKSQRF